MPAPAPGAVIDGYRFKGGNPNDQASWEPVSGAPDDVGQRQEYQTSLQQLRERRAAVDSTAPTMEALDRFERLNQNAGTGGILEQIPMVRTGLNNMFAPNKAEMSSIAGALQTRDVPPGQGAVSNYERELFAQGVPDINRPGPVNQNIINGIRARRQQEVDRLSFMEAYLGRNGTLNGAAELWQGYVQGNPYSRTDERERLVLNGQRQDWRVALMGEAPQSTPRPAATPARPPAPGTRPNAFAPPAPTTPAPRASALAAAPGGVGSTGGLRNAGPPTTSPPPAAVAMLRQNPNLAAAFDQKYGPGASARALGGRRGR